MGEQATTSAGVVEGIDDGGVVAFLGIPYGATTAGDGRLRGPRPVKPWSGARPCRAFGPASPQIETAFLQDRNMDEDCLRLNVWTPSLRGRRPVMVFIHGGAFIFGAASQPMYRGAPLSARGDVVVVTLNYRLGLLGFGSAQGSDDNCGLRDALAALQWVQREIASFGGDPDNVTLFGESAGAFASAALLSSTAARGLFHRMILQSGGLRVTSQESARTVTAGVLAGLGGTGRAALERTSIDALLSAQAAYRGRSQWGVRLDRSGPASRGFHWGVVADGDLIAHDPAGAVAAGVQPDVPLLVGCNAHEWRFFSRLFPNSAWKPDAAGVRAQLGRLLGDACDAVIGTYLGGREADHTTLVEVADAIMGDLTFRIPQLRVLQAQLPHAPCYAYRFEFECPHLDGLLGACHAAELPFVFGTLDSPSGQFFGGDSEAARTLSERMMDAWLAFARSGNPATAGLPEWPRYDLQSRSTMALRERPALRSAPQDAERAVWDALI